MGGHRMPNNGSNQRNGTGTHVSSNQAHRAAQKPSDDISQARTEDLAAILGDSDDATDIATQQNNNHRSKHSRRGDKSSHMANHASKHDDSLDSFDDKQHHRKNRSSSKPSRQRNHSSRSQLHDKAPDKIANRNIAENTAKKMSIAKKVVIACLSIVAIGGIGYAVWNLTPLHSLVAGTDNAVDTTNMSSIDAEAKGRTVNDEKLDFTFEHKGIKYTFTDLTSVAPSETKSANGRETFKVTLKAVNETDEEYPMTSIGVNIFGPNGDYLADMIRNDKVLDDGVDSIEDPVIESGGTYERTLEVPATKSGTYTLEIIDVGTDEIFRVPVDIKVDD